MNSFSWYIDRFKTMSIPEVGYRVQQQVQKQLEKKGTHLGFKSQNFEKVLVNSYSSNISAIPDHLITDFFNYTKFDFFGYSLEINENLNWHLDISSGKSFPLSFSKDIDIRSDKFGSAKVVWEINRLQFLLPIALEYSVTKDKNILKKFISIVNSWSQNNPYLRGVNWYSNIEVNIRLIVWYFCWQVLFQDENLKRDTEFLSFAKEVWLPLIYQHCVYSHNNPSKFSSANNHLIAEYSGLFVATCCWDFDESKNWNKHALQGIEREIQLQYSKNGINKEEAAEYIQFITDFFLIPYAIGTKAGITFSKDFQTSLFKISEYLINLLDCRKNYIKYGDEDDGKVLVVSTNPHFDNFSSILTSAAVIFSDGRFKAFGDQYDLKNWLLFGQKGYEQYKDLQLEIPALNSTFYKDEGHFIFRKVEDFFRKKEIYLYFDAAPLGFLSIAAHGHSDALSVALNVDGFPILSDVGTYTYHTDKEWRKYFISSAAHNTITIDNQNQAVQAGPTMWLDHFEVDLQEARQQSDIELVSAKHSGYDKIGCGHKRTVSFARAKNSFSIQDKVSLNGKRHEVLQPWHLHPDVVVQKITEHSYILSNTKGGRSVKVVFDEQLDLKIVKGQQEPLLGWFSKSFLQKEATNVISLSLLSDKSQELSFTTTLEII